ncbi:thiosulfate oxidation carrier complex protein SoxZ [Magnetospirillum sp. UT-4]|uniref:thiosulfate oxidation carrier complex protein SoxZ n=1 Tax=Magnetospirillum sp. UT-4 TaxID=2681467 RepID=UPI00137C53D4|nr:thiosulfate oxidation carrier complex protein SoxZ [Magnetospirillum sp. UT-4]CAA7624322.1 conserved hypothetical protein [Magnetospirillum sp. UT-4]
MAAPAIKARIPAQAKKGEVIEIKAQITHDMESGQRKHPDGTPIPRRIINKFVCTWNKDVVVSSDWHTAMSANPFVTIYALATESGKITLTYHDDNGEKYEHSADIVVS